MTAIQKTGTASASKGTEMARSETTDRIVVAMENSQEIQLKPLLMLRVELRPAMYQFWLFWRMLKGMDSPVSVCFAINYWVEECGLLVPEAIEILRSTMRPSSVPSVQYGNDLLRLMAERANEVTKRRLAGEADLARKKKSAEEAAKPRATPEELQLLRERFLGSFAELPDDVDQPARKRT